MSWEDLASQLLAQYHIRVDPAALHKALGCAPSPHTSAQQTVVSLRDALQHVLHCNLPDVAVAPGLLPRNAGSLPSAVLESSALVQIQTARDATQPLRPCADMEDAEALLSGAANQKSTNHRLLRLTVSDGFTEVPAVELKTLRAFRQIPTPGEKLLLKAGTEIKNGMVILTDKDVEFLGGSEQHLKDEFLMRRHRLQMGTNAVHGLEGAPRFTPLEAAGVVRPATTTASGGSHRHPSSQQSAAPAPLPPQRGGKDAHRHNAHERGGRGGSRGGRSDTGRGRGGRNRDVDDKPHGRGAARPAHRDPHHYNHQDTAASQRPKTEKAPTFSDADFPELGGSW